MKVLIILLVCSLAANAAYLIVRGLPSSSSAPTPPAATAPETSLSSDAQRKAVATFFDPKRTDAATFKAELEAAGFPPEIARAAARAQVQFEFDERRRAIVGDMPAPPFWKTTIALTFESGIEAEKERALNALGRERDARIREITDGQESTDQLDEYGTLQRWGPLSQDKITAIQRIEGDYSELQRELIAGRSPLNLPAAEQEKIALLNRERRADLERVLSPEELFEYDLRRSPTTVRLRSQLSAFKPTEEEFRTLFRVQFERDTASGRDAAFAGITFLGATDREADRATQLEQAKGLLSPERYAEYEFATDSRNTTLARIASRFGLSHAAAREVAAIRDSASSEMLSLRRDTAKAPDERDAQLAALTRAAAERVVGVLGPDAYRAYLENGGSWLNPSSASVSRPAPPAP